MGDIGKYFNRSEFTCRCGCGKDDIDPGLVQKLDELRGLIARPITVTSGVRCAEQNKKVGGVPGSAHIRGLAVDIRIASSGERFEVLEHVIRRNLFSRIGVAKTFMHLDTDNSKPHRVLWTY